MRLPIRGAAALAVLWLSVPGPASAAEDAQAIIERAFEAAKTNEALARGYVFHERVEELRFDRKGAEKKRQSKTWDVTLFEGSGYWRLIARNDEPLDPEAAAKEQRKLDRHITKLQNETPRQRAQRLAKVEKELREGEEFLEEITQAFDFRLIGEEEIDGIATWAISAEPKPGYEPPNRLARVLPEVRATLWVAQESYGWVQADIETLGDITWAAVFKLRSGTQIRFKQRLLDEKVWITESWSVRYKARIAFLYRMDAELIGTYSNFRRFATDTTVTGWSVID